MDGILRTLEANRGKSPEGDVSTNMEWLWWVPNTSDRELHDGARRIFKCEPCMVTWASVLDWRTRFIKCWSCGRFQKLPFYR